MSLSTKETASQEKIRKYKEQETKLKEIACVRRWLYYRFDQENPSTGYGFVERSINGITLEPKIGLLFKPTRKKQNARARTWADHQSMATIKEIAEASDFYLQLLLEVNNFEYPFFNSPLGSGWALADGRPIFIHSTSNGLLFSNKP